MAIGKRRKEQQEELWVPSVDLVKGPGHPFYQRVNKLLSLLALAILSARTGPMPGSSWSESSGARDLNARG